MKTNYGNSVFLFLLMALAVGCSKQADVPQTTTSAQAQYVSPLGNLEQAKPDAISPQGEIAEIFSFGSDFTDLQRQLKFKEIHGKVIEWRLPVYEVKQSGNGYTIQTSSTIKGEIFGPKYIGTILHITPKGDDDRRFVEHLKTGDLIEVKGVIKDVTLRHLEISPAIIVHSVPQGVAAKPPAAKADPEIGSSTPSLYYSSIPREPLPASFYKGITALEKVTLMGSLETVPMSGAKLIVNSGTRGKVIIGNHYFDNVDYIENSGRKVAVSGTIQNRCSPSERRKAVHWYECAWVFNDSYKITIEELGTISDSTEKIESMRIPQESNEDRLAPMNSRYEIVGDDVLDKETQLIWRRCPEGSKWRSGECRGTIQILSHSDAERYALERANAEGLPWRVPTKEELTTLVSKIRQYPSWDLVAFGDGGGELQHKAPSDYLCCQSMYAIDFGEGKETLVYYFDGLPLRMVRPNSGN